MNGRSLHGFVRLISGKTTGTLENDNFVFFWKYIKKPIIMHCKRKRISMVMTSKFVIITPKIYVPQAVRENLQL